MRELHSDLEKTWRSAIRSVPAQNDLEKLVHTTIFLLSLRLFSIGDLLGLGGRSLCFPSVYRLPYLPLHLIRSGSIEGNSRTRKFVPFECSKSPFV